MPEEIHPYGGGGGGGGAAKVSISGANTDGTLTLISTGTMYMAGGNNITISQDGNSLTFVGMDNVGATTFRGGVSTGGNTLGTTGTVNNQIVFVGGNNVTLSQSAGANSATVTISGPAMFKGGVSNVGNTLGTTGTVSNQILFVGGNNITLSQSSAAGGATITVSGPTTAAQSAQTGISSISVSDTVYTSGQVEFIGSNNVTVKSGAGQKVIIDMTGGGGSFTGGVSSDGNSAGTTGTVSNGILFVGGNNITLSQSSGVGGATITVSGANIGGAQTGISGIAGSGASTATSGTVQFQNSNGITFGLNGNTITASHDGITSQTLQTSNVHNVTLAGNTSGALADISSGTMTIAGGNGITLSQLGNAFTISGPIPREAVSLAGNSTSAGAGYTLVSTGTLILAGGNNITLSQDGHSVTISGANAGGAQTGISSIIGDGTTYTSGAVAFVGSNAASVNSSAAGQTLIIDVPTQTVQPEGTVFFGVSSGGNTLGTTGMASGTGPRLVFVGGTNITLSQSLDAGGSSGTITIVGASGGGAGYTAGLSTGGNTSGDATNVTGRLIFAGGNNITLSGSTNAGSMTITISAPSGGGAGVSSGGNTAGTTGTVDYQLVFVGGNNITLSQSINGSSGTVTISAGASGAGGIAATLAGNSTSAGAGYILVSSGTMTLAGGNNITLSQNGNAVTISAANAGGAQTGISGISASDTVYTSGTVKFTGSNNITVLSGTGQQVIISGPTGGGAGMGSQGNTAGTSGTVGKELWFVGGSNVSLSQSVNGASATLTINAATAGGGQTAISGISASDTVYTSGTVAFTGSNNITIASGAGQQIIVSGPNPFAAALPDTGNTAGTTFVATAGLALVGGSNITLSGSSNGGSGTITIHGASGGGAGFSGGMSTDGNTAGTAGTVDRQVVFVGSNNITLSQSQNASSATITIIGPTGGGAGMGSAGNSAGTSGTVGKELFLYGSNNITLSQSVNGSSASLSIIGAAGGAGLSAGISGGNTSGDTGSVTGRVLFAGGNNITLSGSTNGGSMTITISGPNVGGAQTGISGIADSAATVTVGTVQFANSNGISFGLNGSTMTASHNGLTGIDLNDVGNPNDDAFFLMNTRQIQFQWGVALTGFSTNASRQGLFEVDVVGGTDLATASSDELDVFHIHQSSNNPYLHLMHLKADGTNATGLHIEVAGAAAALLNAPISYESGSVPLILGTSQSNSVANLNANFLQGKASSDFLTAQTVQTQGSVQVNGSTGAITFNAGNNMSLSTNGSSLTYINVLSSSAIAQPVSNVSSAGTQSSNFALADHAHVGVAGLNVSGTASTWVGNVMLSVTNLTLVTGGNSSAGSIGISAAAPGAGGAALGMTNTGNTSGTVFTTATGTVYFQGTNNITVSNSSAAGSLQTLWISGPSGGGAGMGTGTNTSGTSGTVGKELFIYGGAGVGLSQSVNGSSASLSIMPQTLYSYEPFPLEAGAHTGITNVLALGNGTSGPVYMFPMTILNHVRAEYMNLIFQQSFTTNGNSSGRQSGNFQYGLYTRRTGASSTELSLATSSSVSWAVTGNNSSYSINQPTLTGTEGFTYAETNSAGSNISSGYTGAKLLVLPLSYMMTPGVYWMGIMQTVSTNSINVGITNSLFGLNQGTTLQNLAPMGSFTSAYTAGSNMMGGSGGAWMFGKGSWSTAGNVGLPNSMGLQSVTVGGVSNLPFVRFWAKS